MRCICLEPTHHHPKKVLNKIYFVKKEGKKAIIFVVWDKNVVCHVCHETKLLLINWTNKYMGDPLDGSHFRKKKHAYFMKTVLNCSHGL